MEKPNLEVRIYFITNQEQNCEVIIPTDKKNRAIYKPIIIKSNDTNKSNYQITQFYESEVLKISTPIKDMPKPKLVKDFLIEGHKCFEPGEEIIITPTGIENMTKKTLTSYNGKVISVEITTPDDFEKIFKKFM